MPGILHPVPAFEGITAVGIDDAATGLPLARWGRKPDAMGYGGLIHIKTPLIAAAGNGGMLSVANPWTTELVIGRVWCRLTTSAGGAGTMDVGVAANGSTSANTIMTALNINQTGVFDNITDKGASGLSRQTWSATQFVTATLASGSVGAVVGYFMIEVFPT